MRGPIYRVGLSMKNNNRSNLAEEQLPELLLLDDEEFFISMMKIRMQDAKIKSFDKPSELLKLLQDGRIDLRHFPIVLTDQFFGEKCDITGLELGSLLKRDWHYKGKVILMSSGVFEDADLIGKADYLLEKSAYSYEEILQLTGAPKIAEQSFAPKDLEERAKLRHDINSQLAIINLAAENLPEIGIKSFQDRSQKSISILQKILPKKWLNDLAKSIATNDRESIKSHTTFLQHHLNDSEEWSLKEQGCKKEKKASGILISLKDYNRKKFLDALSSERQIDIITSEQEPSRATSSYEVFITDDIDDMSTARSGQQIIYAANLPDDILMKRIEFYLQSIESNESSSSNNFG